MSGLFFTDPVFLLQTKHWPLHAAAADYLSNESQADQTVLVALNSVDPHDLLILLQLESACCQDGWLLLSFDREQGLFFVV